MGTILQDDPAPINTSISFGEISSGASADVAFANGWSLGPFESLGRLSEQQEAGLGTINSEPGNRSGRLIRNAPDSPLLSNDEAEAQFGIPGQLSFDKAHYPNGVRQREAELLHTWKSQEIERSDALRRATPGFLPGVARFGAGLAATALDPINLGASFVPVVGEARYASLLEAAGDSLIARTAVRAGVGAIEGAVGVGVGEPITYLQARNQQSDYSAYDALSNVTFGVIGGAFLRAGGGAIADFVRGGRPRPAGAVPAPLADDMGIPPLAPEDHAAALKGAIAAVGEDRPVDVAAYLRLASRRSELMEGSSLSTDAARLTPEDLASVPRRSAVTVLQDGQAKLQGTSLTFPDRWHAELYDYGRRLEAGEKPDLEVRARLWNAFKDYVEDQGATKVDTREHVFDADQGRVANPNLGKEVESGYPRFSHPTDVDDLARDYHGEVGETAGMAGSVVDPDLLPDWLRREHAANAPGAPTGGGDLTRLGRQMMDALVLHRAEISARGDFEGSAAALAAVDRQIERVSADYRASETGTPEAFERAWNDMVEAQRQGYGPTEREASLVAAVDRAAKDYRQPATPETERAEADEWGAHDDAMISAQREAGNLTPDDEMALAQGQRAAADADSRAAGIARLAQCLTGI